jgi:NADH-quinone oxidoreductase subunit M
MGEWIMFNGVLQTATVDMDPLRTTMFALGILATVLSSAYILWMFKRIFFGKIPEELAHVKDSNRYITATMAVFAAMTLIIGVLPDLFLAPISDYIGGMFEGQEGVLPVPVHVEGSATDDGFDVGGGSDVNLEDEPRGESG